jgi:hypothetical protein
MFMPPECQWRDDVEIDRVKRLRTVTGGNVPSGVRGADDRAAATIVEHSTYSACLSDDESSLDSTLFKRTVELNVRGVPDYFVASCVRMYMKSTVAVRQKEADAIRAEQLAKAKEELSKNHVGGAAQGLFSPSEAGNSSSSSGNLGCTGASCQYQRGGSLASSWRQTLLTLLAEGGGIRAAAAITLQQQQQQMQQAPSHRPVAMTARGVLVHWGLVLALGSFLACCIDRLS